MGCMAEEFRGLGFGVQGLGRNYCKLVPLQGLSVCKAFRDSDIGFNFM